MSKIVSFFTSIVMFILSFIGYMPVTNDLSVETLSADSWGGETVMFQGEEINVSADCETVTGGSRPVFRFDKSASLSLDAKCNGFNYYGIVYGSSNDLKCEMKYTVGFKSHTEVFFLEKCEGEQTFYSFTENYKKGKNITSLKFTNLGTGTAELTLFGFSVFNRTKPADDIYIENGSYKIGVSTVYGGALEYMEYLTDNIQAVKLSDGTVKVAPDAKATYGGTLLTSHVNLINRHDSGRYIQQSYYGTSGGKKDGYETGTYMDTVWPYNPVQGGNQFGDHSRIIDYKVTEDSIYVKCRPMDWAKNADCITSSYMEATYTLLDDAVLCECSFIDFSGYSPRYTEQEVPAVYFIEPLNSFAYSNENKFFYENDLLFWGDHPEQYCYTDVGISGFFSGENGFGAGIYMPGINKHKVGVYHRENESKLGKDPSVNDPTSYIAPIAEYEFRSFEPVSYSFILAAGTADEIKTVFDGYSLSNSFE